MNPETSITNEQIADLFAYHKLASNPAITRIPIGFTNEIHQVDNFILKIYVRKNGEKNLIKESNHYINLYKKVLVPELIVSDTTRTIIDKPYIIYNMIAGEPLGNKWHLLNNEQRKQLISSVCDQLKIIRTSNQKPVLESGLTWKEQIISTINGYLEVVAEKHLITDDVLSAIKSFVKTYQNVLDKEILGLSYWDLHLDNLIVDEQAILVGIIDFEHVDVVSIDYMLNMIRQMMKYPHLNLSEEMEKHANTKDYTQLMVWFKEYYPELYNFENLEKRIDLYELETLLRLLPRFPDADNIHTRINDILSK